TPRSRSSNRATRGSAAELSGAVGDLGTYIPIVLTLTLVSHLDLGTTLIFTSLYNIATGLLFDIPMPVHLGVGFVLNFWVCFFVGLMIFLGLWV
ncbi:molybdate transporter 2, partial [Quercus suber]